MSTATTHTLVQFNDMDFFSGYFFEEAFEATMDARSECLDMKLCFTGFDGYTGAPDLEFIDPMEVENREAELGLQLLEAELPDFPSDSSIEVENREPEPEPELQLLEAEMPDFLADPLMEVQNRELVLDPELELELWQMLQCSEAEMQDYSSDSSMEVQNGELELSPEQELWQRLQLFGAEALDFSADSPWMNSMAPPVPTVSGPPVPAVSPETLSSSTTPSSRTTPSPRSSDVHRMRNKEMINELKDDYLVPSWAVEGKRIQDSMLGDPVLARRKLEDNEKFVEGHKPMSKGNLKKLLLRCRQGPKLDISLSTLHAVLVEMQLFTAQQWALFKHERETGIIPRSRKRRSLS